MPENISVTLGSHYENFVARQLAEGRFEATDEVIRAGLRLLEEKEMRLSALRHALIAGEQSGMATDFSFAKMCEELELE